MGGFFSSPTNVPETTPYAGAPKPINRPEPEPESQKLEPNPKGAELEEKGDDEEGECGFCLFMKSGKCKEVFIEWQKCVKEVEDAKEDTASKCSKASEGLFKCMEVHKDFYGALLGVKDKLDEEEASTDSEKKEQGSNLEPN